MKVIGAVIVVALAVVIPAAVRSDIVVFKNGTYEEGTIKSVSDTSLTMESPYGDLPYARELIASAHASVAEQPGQEYYQAGLVLLQLHQKDAAKKLFEKATEADTRYRALSAKALRDYTPAPSSNLDSSLHAPATGDPRRVPTYRVPCSLCKGTGRVEYKIQKVTMLRDNLPVMGFVCSPPEGSDGGSWMIASCSGRGRSGAEDTFYMRCPACNGKGYRLLRISSEEGLCPICMGAGSIQEKEKRVDSWVFNYVPCPGCSGRGIRPLRSGAIQLVAATNQNQFPGQPGGEAYKETEDEEIEDDEDVEEEESSDDGFLKRYGTYLLVGGGALLIVALVAMQMSKGNK
jgi:hypothetical protein